MKTGFRDRWLVGCVAWGVLATAAASASAQGGAAPARTAARDVPGQAAPQPAQAASAAAPSRSWQPSLKELGMPGAMRLRGVDSEGRVRLNIRRDEMVATARLKLRFTLSPSLLPDLSHLKVLLNDQLVQTVVLSKDRLGQPQTVEMDIDPAYFVDFNRLRFQFIGHYTLECEDPEHSSLWAEISPETSLVLGLQPLPLRAELDVLPAPFFDERDSRPVDVPFVYASQPSLGQLKAAGSLASWLGALAAYRGNRFPVFANELPPRNAIVIATNDNRPDFLRDLPAVDQPTLSMMAHPNKPGALLLLVLGSNDEQVQRAADTLVLGKAALSGQSMRVKQLDYPPLRKAYDAPRWVSTERPVQLGELVERPEDLQVRGSTLDEELRISARMPPDLFAWDSRGVPLNLLYQYTPTVSSDHGLLSISINDQFLKSYPLLASEEARSKAGTVMLPFGNDDLFKGRSDVRIPAFMVGGDNQLQFTFQIPTTKVGRCRSIQPVVLQAAVDPQSTLDLTDFHHYIAMPSMAAFANSGFPFTRHADLSQTSVVLPSRPTPADVQLYLTALARMAAATGYPGTRFKLLQPAQLGQAGDTDILLISEGDRDGVLQRWSADLPALVAAGKRSVQPMERAMNAFSDLFRMKSGSVPASERGQALLEGDGPLAAVLGMQSPLRSGRSVVALSASDAPAMALLAGSLNDPGKVQAFHGDLTLLRGDAIESFRVKPTYYVGALPWWKRLWFHLHASPIWLALAGILAGLLLTALVHGALRVRARRRLDGDHA